MINGIDYLKKQYPGRDEKDYQPSGLDLRLGKVYVASVCDDKPLGIYGNKKVSYEIQQIPPIIINDEGVERAVYRLDPHRPYLCEVQDQIQIGDHNAQLYKPRSTLLRNFVNVYTAVGDLGYNGHLSFLVINHGVVPYHIEIGERFAQLVDFEVRGGSESYDGDYQEEVIQ